VECKPGCCGKNDSSPSGNTASTNRRKADRRIHYLTAGVDEYTATGKKAGTRRRAEKGDVGETRNFGPGVPASRARAMNTAAQGCHYGPKIRAAERTAVAGQPRQALTNEVARGRLIAYCRRKEWIKALRLGRRR
jgi:hypothetical protein